MKTATAIEFTANVKAFSFERAAAEHRISVDENGIVRVWDDAAGHYTTCHAMSKNTQDRLRKIQRV